MDAAAAAALASLSLEPEPDAVRSSAPRALLKTASSIQRRACELKLLEDKLLSGANLEAPVGTETSRKDAFFKSRSFNTRSLSCNLELDAELPSSQEPDGNPRQLKKSLSMGPSLSARRSGDGTSGVAVIGRLSSRSTRSSSLAGHSVPEEEEKDHDHDHSDHEHEHDHSDHGSTPSSPQKQEDILDTPLTPERTSIRSMKSRLRTSTRFDDPSPFEDDHVLAGAEQQSPAPTASAEADAADEGDDQGTSSSSKDRSRTRNPWAPLPGPSQKVSLQVEKVVQQAARSIRTLDSLRIRS